MTEPSASTRRYAVLQAGARMHYAVPALLARASTLTAFYTDLHSSHWPLQALDALWPRALQPKALKRLFGRQLLAELPRRLVRDHPWPASPGPAELVARPWCLSAPAAGASAAPMPSTPTPLDRARDVNTAPGQDWVQASRLDGFSWPDRFAYIKIDVEGAEQLVLTGSEKQLGRADGVEL